MTSMSTDNRASKAVKEREREIALHERDSVMLEFLSQCHARNDYGSKVQQDAINLLPAPCCRVFVGTRTDEL